MDENWKKMFDSMWEREGSDFIQFLLNAGLEVNTLNKYGSTMLSHAAENGNLDMIKYLEREGADYNVKNSNGYRPLLVAAESNRGDVVNFFLDKETFVEERLPMPGVIMKHWVGHKWSSITCASMSVWFNVLKDHTTRGCFLNPKMLDRGTLFLLDTCYSDLGEVVHCIELSCQRAEPFLFRMACVRGWIDVVKYLVSKGYDINAEFSDGEIPVFLAASHSQLALVEHLIHSGAVVKRRNNNGLMLIHYACIEGWVNIVKYLLDKGWDFNEGHVCEISPLLYAIWHRRMEVVEILLKLGGLYFNSFDYMDIKTHPLMKDILQDTELCARAILNKYNNSDLKSIYNIPVLVDRLPAIGKLKIATCSNVAQDIANCVENEIISKGHCDVINARPIVLSSLCVTFISKYFGR